MTKMKLSDYIMRGLSLLLIIVLLILTQCHPDAIEDTTSKKGLMELNEARNDIVVLAKQLNAKIWGYGGRRRASKSHWAYTGAHVNVAECVTYDRFEQAIMDVGFKKKSSSLAVYCRRDVTLSSITSDDSHTSGYGENKHRFLCGDILFDITWKEGKNKDEKTCW